MAKEPLPGTHLEYQILRDGFRFVCGVDEVGRGPLSGPVVAAAVILPLRVGDAMESTACCHFPDSLVGINDSKKLSAGRRDYYRCVIQETAQGVCLGMVGPEEIDRINIRQATLLAMSRAIQGLSLQANDFILVDGRDLPKELPCPARAVVRGDQHSISIAAASIVAKEARDALMVKLAAQYPGYGWEHNKGYPTKEHCQALTRLGVTEQHRRTFAPVQTVIKMAKQ